MRCSQLACHVLVHNLASFQPHFKHAYRSVGTHPDSWRVTGMSWCFSGSTAPTYLYDKRLPFGARASPMIFHRLTQAACRIMGNKGYTVLAYLDDSLIIEPTHLRCRAAFDMLLSLQESLGFTINWTKVLILPNA